MEKISKFREPCLQSGFSPSAPRRNAGCGLKAVKRVLLLISPLVMLSWITPEAWLHYPGTDGPELGVIWNTNHRIYRTNLAPGEITFDWGDIFPDKKFFMSLEWRGGTSGSHCLEITPTILGTHIYLKADGSVDTRPDSGTDTELIRSCYRSFGG